MSKSFQRRYNEGASAWQHKKRLEKEKNEKAARESTYRYSVLNGICLDCSGSGRKWHFFDCGKCRGTGRVTHCQACNGTGRSWIIFPCGYCHGRGRIQEYSVTEDEPIIYAEEAPAVPEYYEQDITPKNHHAVKKEPPFASIIVISGALVVFYGQGSATPRLLDLILYGIPIGGLLGMLFGRGRTGFFSGILAWLIGGLFAFFAMSSMGHIQ